MFFIKFILNRVDIISSGVFSINDGYIVMHKIEVDFIERIYILWRKNGINALSDIDVIIYWLRGCNSMWKQKNTGADICGRILLWMVHQRFRHGRIFLRIQNIASAMNMTAREVREYLDILLLSGVVGCTPFSPGASERWFITESVSDFICSGSADECDL